MKMQSARVTIYCLRTLEWFWSSRTVTAGKREIIARYGLALGLNRKRGYLNHYKTTDEAKDALVKLVTPTEEEAKAIVSAFSIEEASEHIRAVIGRGELIEKQEGRPSF